MDYYLVWQRGLAVAYPEREGVIPLFLTLTSMKQLKVEFHPCNCRCTDKYTLQSGKKKSLKLISESRTEIQVCNLA